MARLTFRLAARVDVVLHVARLAVVAGARELFARVAVALVARQQVMHAAQDEILVVARRLVPALLGVAVGALLAELAVVRVLVAGVAILGLQVVEDELALLVL